VAATPGSLCHSNLPLFCSAFCPCVLPLSSFSVLSSLCCSHPFLPSFSFKFRFLVSLSCPTRFVTAVCWTASATFCCAALRYSSREFHLAGKSHPEAAPRTVRGKALVFGMCRPASRHSTPIQRDSLPVPFGEKNYLKSYVRYSMWSRVSGIGTPLPKLLDYFSPSGGGSPGPISVFANTNQGLTPISRKDEKIYTDGRPPLSNIVSQRILSGP